LSHGLTAVATECRAFGALTSIVSLGGSDLIATSVWISQNAYDIFSPFKILPVCRL
jgi:hypothetical protein